MYVRAVRRSRYLGELRGGDLSSVLRSSRTSRRAAAAAAEMGWSEMEARCRRHPKHRQSKGVCPSCLRERLSQISASSSTRNSSTTFSSPGTSYDSVVSSSAASSSPGTPAADRRRRRRRRDAGAQIALPAKAKGWPEPLTKSRSLAFVIANPLGGGRKEKKGEAEAKDEEKRKSKGVVDGEEEEGKAVKRSFWSKLVVGGGKKKKKKKEKELFHSKTVRESASARWTFLP